MLGVIAVGIGLAIGVYIGYLIILFFKSKENWIEIILPLLMLASTVGAFVTLFVFKNVILFFALLLLALGIGKLWDYIRYG